MSKETKRCGRSLQRLVLRLRRRAWQLWLLLNCDRQQRFCNKIYDNYPSGRIRFRSYKFPGEWPVYKSENEVAERTARSEGTKNEHNTPESAVRSSDWLGDKVDAALAWFDDVSQWDCAKSASLGLGMHDSYSDHDDAAGKVLATEVIRLRGDMVVMRAMVKAGCTIEEIDSALSPNDVAHSRREVEGGAK